MLSVQSFARAVEDAKRLMPGKDVERVLSSTPDLVLQLQKGADMIPYDAIPPNPPPHAGS